MSQLICSRGHQEANRTPLYELWSSRMIILACSYKNSHRLLIDYFRRTCKLLWGRWGNALIWFIRELKMRTKKLYSIKKVSRRLDTPLWNSESEYRIPYFSCIFEWPRKTVKNTLEIERSRFEFQQELIHCVLHSNWLPRWQLRTSNSQVHWNSRGWGAWESLPESRPESLRVDQRAAESCALQNLESKRFQAIRYGKNSISLHNS